AEVVALAAAFGRVTAAKVVARRTHPPCDVSAMDGYAVRAIDVAEGVRLRVTGSAPAGHPFAGTVASGEAVRIFTGSVVPAGADTVVIQENAIGQGSLVSFSGPVAAGQHIRSKGLDFSQGDILIPAGRRVSARDVGLAAAANYPWLAVHQAPRVAILATGDEIALPGEPLPDGGIISSNAHALAALVRAVGGAATILPIAPDRAELISEAAERTGGMDFLLTTGGASVGEHDLVQAGLSQRGFALDFWKVAMRPGKPLISGAVRGVPMLGLPGNPVSSMVCAILFLVPALARLSGLADERLPTTVAALGAAVRANDARTDHLRAALSRDPDGALIATPFARQDSSMMRLFAEATALICRPPYAPALPRGAKVPVIRLDHLGI
ncbi:MAG: molybdopterin molybdotransferase MoeA, partial [Acetobacteraceae bacterium]